MSTISAESLLQETKQERNERFKTQLYYAAVKGLLQGSLFALVSGYYLSYKYNHGPRTVYFKTAYKVWWVIGWNVVGLTFATDNEKIKISRQAAIEDEIKRNRYLEEELKRYQK
ncbi:hypothetical protein SBY92_004533 [Candida maltosa Xu316]